MAYGENGVMKWQNTAKAASMAAPGGMWHVGEGRNKWRHGSSQRKQIEMAAQ
jgi:hypothetical protein